MGATPPFVLASTSPRRSQLLADAGLQFYTLDPGDEPSLVGLEVAELVSELALAKALAGLANLPVAWRKRGVIGADTLVAAGDLILPKPLDHNDARRMLQLLSGSQHQVLTGCALVFADGRHFRRTDIARVEFASIPSAALESYLMGEEWADKAGAYGIQGWAGQWASLVSGSFKTVMGLDPKAVIALFEQSNACPPPSS